ncbi:2Fe-2S iron-sulfur cluster-binding protein [Tepidibacillus marianensis]|uniref:2Fe-2S iron-sulfur cluster-binding protein n=1 Tax=Tepidibacillus marianensis TaxID=3131995 RepID=UPI0030D411A9
MAARTVYIDDGDKQVIQYVETGKTLLEIIQNEGFSLAATCGGTGRCGTCRVKIKEALPYNRTEGQLLTSSEKKKDTI